MARYCSEACQEEARRWRQWKGAATLSRVPERQAEAAGSEPPLSSTPEGAASARKRCPHRCEGHPYDFLFWCSCDRPGCYEEFERTRRSPPQRFCSHACRHALERVLERELHWRERRLEHERMNNSPAAGYPLRR
jgi:predicted nucleic acid-binding Zn ribbon protein